MKNITQSFKSMAVLLLSLLGLNVQAQETISLNGVEVTVASSQTVTVDVVEKTSYSGDSVDFSVDEIVNALGIDSIGEASQYVVNVTTNEAVENTTDGWRDSSGDLASWGNDGGVCVKIDYPETGWVDYIGCYDESWEAGDTYTAIWAFVANDKAALVNVVINFVDNGIPDAPEAELAIANITRVGSAAVTLERYASDGYNTSSVEVSVAGMASALGLDASELSQYFAQDVYVAYNDVTMGYKVDSLQLLSETDGWLQQTAENYDGVAGDLTQEVCGSYYSYGTISYFIQNLAYDAETEVVTYDMGQMPSALSVGDTLYVDMYVMNGTNAYVIRHTTIIVEEPTTGFDEMVQVGSEDVVLEMYPMTDYTSITWNPDIETIAAALGCDAASVGFKALTSSGSFSANTTANNGGYWLDADGYVCSWGSTAAIFLEPVESADLSAISVGQYPSTFSVGDSLTATLYFTYDANYYLVNFTLRIVEKPVVTFDEMENVGTRSVNIQMLQDNDYNWSGDGTLSWTDIYALLGTTDVTLYGDEVDDDGNVSKTESYTMSPTPGFWLTADGYVTSWGSSSVWGMTTGVSSSDDDLIFNYIQFPSSTAVGDVYTGVVYLVSLEEAKYITVNLKLSIVESIVETEEVGTGTLAVPVYSEDTGSEFSLAKIAELLEVTEDDIAASECMHAQSGIQESVTPSTGLEFDLNGNCVSSGNGVIILYFENGMAYAVATADIPEDLNLSVEVAFELNAKIYVLTVSLMAPDVYVGVNSIEAAQTTDATMYDLSGRKVKGNSRGVVISNGKKIVLK